MLCGDASRGCLKIGVLPISNPSITSRNKKSPGEQDCDFIPVREIRTGAENNVVEWGIIQA